MSGGSYNYLYDKINAAADNITNRNNSYHREKFSNLLRLVADAMHNIEWVDSCDYGPGDENAAIEACFQSFTSAESHELFLKKADIYNKIQELVKEFTKDE